MFQKPCRLSRYDKAYLGGGGHGGSTKIDFRQPSEEWPAIQNWYGKQQGQFFDLINKYPVLQAMQQNALDYNKALPATLASLQSQFGGLPAQLQQQFGGLPSQLMGMSDQLQNQFHALPSQLMSLTPTLLNTSKGYLSKVIGSEGALSPEAQRAQDQQTYQSAVNVLGGGGGARQEATVANAALNRQAAREARYNTALGQYNAATGQIGALDQLAQGLGTGLAQTRAGLLQGAQGLGIGLGSARQALGTGLAGAIQGLQSGGLNQLGTTATTAQGVFSGLENPILSYLGNLFSNNLQGSIAQAQINQAGNLASGSSTSGLISGILSAVGSIAAAY